MESEMEHALQYINHTAVFVAAAVNIVVGVIWYSPLMFHNAWKREIELSDHELRVEHPWKRRFMMFFLSLISAYNLAFFIAGPGTNWRWGLTAGFLVGFGWASIIFTIIAKLENRTWTYISINAGYIIVYFSLCGFILGIWR